MSLGSVSVADFIIGLYVFVMGMLCLILNFRLERILRSTGISITPGPNPYDVTQDAELGWSWQR